MRLLRITDGMTPIRHNLPLAEAEGKLIPVDGDRNSPFMPLSSYGIYESNLGPLDRNHFDIITIQI